MSDTRTYKDNPKNKYGIEHQKYINSLLQLAYSKPSEYYRLQTEVSEAILDANTDLIYDTVYNLLRNGTDKNNRQIIDTDQYDYLDGQWNPSYPEQKCAEIADEITADFVKNIKNKVMEIILPDSIYRDAMARTRTKANAEIDV